MSSVVDRIERGADGVVHVRMRKEPPGAESWGVYHRAALDAGADLKAVKAALDAHLVEMGHEALDDVSWADVPAAFGRVYARADGGKGKDWTGQEVVAAKDGAVRLRVKGDADEDVLGVVQDAKASALVGDAASPVWTHPQELGADGAPKTASIEFVSWIEPVYETQQIVKETKVKRTAMRPKVEVVQVPSVARQVVLGEDGKHRFQEAAGSVPRERVVTRPVQIFNDDGTPRVSPDGGILWADIPVEEEVEVEEVQREMEDVQVQVGAIEHVYRADAVPRDVTVPEDAARSAVDLPVENAAFAPDRVEVRAGALFLRPGVLDAAHVVVSKIKSS